jgi:hypothetical protein
MYEEYAKKKAKNPSPTLKFIPQNTLHENHTADKFYCGDCISY